MTIQYIKDEEGKDQYVVIPYSDYFRMRLALLEYDDEDENDWEDIPYESDIYDNVMLPGEVCDVMHKENVSLQAAWRILRGLSSRRSRLNSASASPRCHSWKRWTPVRRSAPAKNWRRFTAVPRSKSASICRKRVNSTSPRPCRRSARPGVRERTLHKSSASDPGGLFACARRSYRNRHADHHLRRLAQVLTCFGKGVKHKSFLFCIPHPEPLPKGEGGSEM